MRFFAHDGTSTHGPAGIDDLLKLPGFDGDTLVCPVGSDDSADWKPAIAYAPFKKALLEAATATVGVSVPAFEPPKPSASPMLAALMPIGGAPMISPVGMSAPPSFALPLPTPAPAPVKTTPCPRCAHANLEDARFCNKCGAGMTASVEPPKPIPEPAPPAELPKPTPPVEPPLPAPPIDPPKPPLPADFPPSPAPVDISEPPPLDLPRDAEPPPYDPFSRLDPLNNFPPAEPEPPMTPEPARRPLQPTEPPRKMGQLAAFEDSEPAFGRSPAPALAPEPEAAAAKPPAWKRPPVLAAAAAILLIGAAAAYMTSRKAARGPAVAELTPAFERPAAPAPSAAISEPAPAEPLYSTPAPTSSPSIPDPRAAKAKTKPRPKAPKAAAPKPAAPAVVAEPKPKRVRPPRASRAPKPEPAAKPEAGDQDPLLEALLTDATQGDSPAEAAPAAPPKAAAKPAAAKAKTAPKPSAFSLPGLSRPVSASDRAAAASPETPPSAAAEPAVTKMVASLDTPSLAEPGSPPPGIENEPAKSAEGDQLALVQVHEQFDFCTQLLEQGAYGDHYDTCLCKDAREAAPYRGRRGAYVTAKKKDSSDGRLESSAKILSSKIDGNTAVVKARWSGSGKPRDASQTWKLEDGLWCQAP